MSLCASSLHMSFHLSYIFSYLKHDTNLSVYIYLRPNCLQFSLFSIRMFAAVQQSHVICAAGAKCVWVNFSTYAECSIPRFTFHEHMFAFFSSRFSSVDLVGSLSVPGQLCGPASHHYAARDGIVEGGSCSYMHPRMSRDVLIRFEVLEYCSRTKCCASFIKYLAVIDRSKVDLVHK